MNNSCYATHFYSCSEVSLQRNLKSLNLNLSEMKSLLYQNNLRQLVICELHQIKCISPRVTVHIAILIKEICIQTCTNTLY